MARTTGLLAGTQADLLHIVYRYDTTNRRTKKILLGSLHLFRSKTIFRYLETLLTRCEHISPSSATRTKASVHKSEEEINKSTSIQNPVGKIFGSPVHN